MIKISGKLPTLNEYIELERKNKFLAAKLKKAYTNLISAQVRLQTKEKLTGLYDVILTWNISGKSDPDNVYFAIKFILDGFVQAGILQDDSQKHIMNISHILKKCKKGQDCVIVNFMEVGNE